MRLAAASGLNGAPKEAAARSSHADQRLASLTLLDAFR